MDNTLILTLLGLSCASVTVMLVLLVVVFSIVLGGQRRYLQAGSRALEAQRGELSGQLRSVLGNSVLTGTWSGRPFRAEFSNNDQYGPALGKGYLTLTVSELPAASHLQLRLGPRAPLSRLGAALLDLHPIKAPDPDLMILTSHPAAIRGLLSTPGIDQHLRTLLGQPTGRLNLRGSSATLTYSAPRPAEVRLSALMDALLSLVRAIPQR